MKILPLKNDDLYDSTEDCKGPSTLILDSVEDCCFECSVFPGCVNFTYGIANKTCILLGEISPLVWDATGDCVSGGVLGTAPNPVPSLPSLMPGVCYDGDTVATMAGSSVLGCEDDCARIGACVKWTYRMNSSICSLEGGGATKSSEPGCISGSAPNGGMLPCRVGSPGVANFAECNGQGTCGNGTCACKGGYTGANCEHTPMALGNCSIHHGICYDASTPLGKGPFGIRNASTVGDCCYMCDVEAACTNFVYNTTAVTCTLLGVAPAKAAMVVGDPTCISGDATEHIILPCRDAVDCNNQGTCNSGKCNCTSGFNGPLCEFVEKAEGNCTTTAGRCITGSALFTNAIPADAADDCCYECTKHTGFMGPDGTRLGACLSFSYNSSDSTCLLFADVGVPVEAPLNPLDSACISGVGAPVPNSECSALYIQAGVKLEGGEIGSATPKSTLGGCCALCEKTPLCANYTVGGDLSCSLHNAGANATSDGSSISGSSNDHALPCREKKGKADCSGQGTCAAGVCTCPTGFSGANCEHTPSSLGGCMIDAGTCLVGTKLL